MKNKKNKISQRVNDVLKNHKINDIKELKNITADEFLHWNDCGRKATEEIMDLMKSLNIKFKPEQIECEPLWLEDDLLLYHSEHFHNIKEAICEFKLNYPFYYHCDEHYYNRFQSFILAFRDAIKCFVQLCKPYKHDDIEF